MRRRCVWGFAAAIGLTAGIGCDRILGLNEADTVVSATERGAAASSSEASAAASTGASGGSSSGGGGGARSSGSGVEPACDPGDDGGAPACDDPEWSQWTPGAPGPYTISPDTLTVLDTHTGLMWMRDEKGSQSWEGSVEYCDKLDVAGFSDWRLPTRIELDSLVDYAQPGPVIDLTAFPASASKPFWSSTELPDNPPFAPVNPKCDGLQCAFMVDFAAGGGGPETKTYDYHARCVRRPQ